jgi:hypothetical protein
MRGCTKLVIKERLSPTKETNIRAGNICQSCKNNPHYNHAGGYKWKYKLN